MLEDVEGLNKEVIREYLAKSLEQKLKKVDADISSYQQKLESIEQDLKKLGNQKTSNKSKDLERKMSFYLSQINSLKNKKEKINSDYDQCMQMDGDNN